MIAFDFTLYGHHASGDVYEVVLFFALTGHAYSYKHVDILEGETKSDAFTALNPFQEVPVLAHGDRVITQSDAILRYPADEIGRFGGRDPDEQRHIRALDGVVIEQAHQRFGVCPFQHPFADFKPEIIDFYQKRAGSRRPSFGRQRVAGRR